MTRGVPNGSAKETSLTQHWTDTRVKAKAEGAAKLETIRRQALWAAAHRSRQEAIATGSPRYTGHVCRHHGHGSERFTECGGCVVCCREAAARRRRLKGAGIRGSYPNGRHPVKSSKRHAARIAKAMQA